MSKSANEILLHLPGLLFSTGSAFLLSSSFIYSCSSWAPQPQPSWNLFNSSPYHHLIRAQVADTRPSTLFYLARHLVSLPGSSAELSLHC